MLQSDATLTLARTVATDQVRVNDDATTSRKISPFDEHGQFRNALAPRGGVSFDGSAGNKIAVALIGQALAADPFNIVIGYRCPPTLPRGAIIAIGSSAADIAQGGAFSVEHEFSTPANLVVNFYGASSSDYRGVRCTGFFTAYLGKEVELAVSRNADGTVSICANGVPITPDASYTGGTPPAWSKSLTSTYLVAGYSNSTTALSGVLRFASLYNLALAPADVQDLFELGGGVVERCKWGSQANRNTFTNAYAFGAADANAISSLGGGSGAYAMSVVAGQRTGGAGAYFFRATSNNVLNAAAVSGNLPTTIPVLIGQKVMVRVWAKATVAGSLFTFYPVLAGAGFTPGLGGSSGISQLLTASWAQYTFLVPITAVGAIGSFSFSGPTSSTVGDTLDFDDLEIVVQGAIVHLPLDDGLGCQLQDVSANRLHALMSATGVTHVAPFAGPVPLSGTTNTSGNQQLLGASCVPLGLDLEVWARSESGTPTIDLGNISGGAQVVSAAALTTTWKKLTLVNGSHVTSTNNLWVKSNTTDVVDVKIFQKDIRL